MVESEGRLHSEGAESSRHGRRVRSLAGPAPKIGVWAWSFVGFVVALIIVVTALGAVSEIALPLLFAAVLAVIFKPLAGSLERHSSPASPRACSSSACSPLMVVVVVATSRGVIDQTDEIGASVDAAVNKARQTSSASTRPRWRTPGRQARPRPRRSPSGFLPAGLRPQLGGRLRRRRDPGRADHVLPAQGRHPAAAGRRRPGRRLDPGRSRRLHRRRMRDPARLRAGPHRDVRDRGRGRRHRRPAARPPARVHDRGGELRRRLHPLHRRVPRRRPRGDRRPRRRRARRRRRDARGRAGRRTCCWRTSSSPR